MRKYYSVELNQVDASKFRQYLKENSFTFETSACYNNIHFEVLTSVEELETINDWMENNL